MAWVEWALSARDIEESLVGTAFTDAEVDRLAALGATREVAQPIGRAIDALVGPRADKTNPEPRALIRLIGDGFCGSSRWRRTKGHGCLFIGQIGRCTQA